MYEATGRRQASDGDAVWTDVRFLLPNRPSHLVEAGLRQFLGVGMEKPTKKCAEIALIAQGDFVAAGR